jgi:uncharacterized protein YecT (DUF1311 family)
MGRLYRAELNDGRKQRSFIQQQINWIARRDRNAPCPSAGASASRSSRRSSAPVSMPNDSKTV